MFQRYLALGLIPELRTEPVQSEKVGQELEVRIPIDDYWEVQEIIKKMRYARLNGSSTQRLWREFTRLIFHRIVTEKDRIWYKKRIPY